MTIGSNKESLKEEWLQPKPELRKERIYNGFTTSYLGSCIGVSRRQYEMKEKGVYPFHDYEMAILSFKLNKSIDELFFENLKISQ
ncbi:helix-turn-helix transcriptional regulator [Apilactobacillus timberlakei]|uniref:helix-turn-helix transcriptional regulator n=1 Tax=Apilactobacillus timberlakei TaxID=2008380 RepID=UPI00112CA037|nr:XRE family transcriptional regulator [Apilactobacillus timberlakei]TPR12256.1 XRE family transcriptional regulator [Apilactobacillus timberlakei]